MTTIGVVQRYRLECYGQPGSNMEVRSAYQFNRAQIAAAFAQWAGERRFDTLIDIGSSTGFLTRRLKPFASCVVAVDADSKGLACIRDPEIQTVQDLLPDLALLSDNSADVVVSTDTLYYLEETDAMRAIERIAAILRVGGYLVINDNLLADRLAATFQRWFVQVERIWSPVSLKPSPNFDRLYWIVESRYLTCRGVFNALKDPDFNPVRDLSEIHDHGLIRICLRQPWLRFALPLTLPVRSIARWIWSNNWLLNMFCVRNVPSPCLSIFRRQ